jgi:hypothetical protein
MAGCADDGADFGCVVRGEGVVMKRCKSKTKQGRRCFNQALSGGEYCHTHRSNNSSDSILAIGAGAFIGNLIAPGIGGIALGGLTGKLFQKLAQGGEMNKSKIFVSFDFDNDRVLKDFILGQAKLEDSPFEVVDHSLKEAAPERDWEKKARAAINRADIVLVMVGQKTHKAHGVLKEVAMAREAGVKIVQIIGYKSGEYTPVPDAGRLYAWNWNNLKKLLG